jgi:hypothetical protein
VAHHLYNQEQAAHGEPTVSLGRYIVSSDFGVRLMENWQSEFLQFALFILLTVWLVQRGSAESKEPRAAGLRSDREQMVGEHALRDSPLWARVGGMRQRVYENSLVIAMFVLFIGSWLAQSLTGWNDFNDDQVAHGEAALSWINYLGTAEFWDRSLQNWQSEFLAVGTMAIFAVYLRQRGSPESKPVGERHHVTTNE